MTDDIDPPHKPHAARKFNRQMRKENNSLCDQNDAFRTDQALVSERIAATHFPLSRRCRPRQRIHRALQVVRKFADRRHEQAQWGNDRPRSFQPRFIAGLEQEEDFGRKAMR